MLAGARVGAALSGLMMALATFLALSPGGSVLALPVLFVGVGAACWTLAPFRLVGVFPVRITALALVSLLEHR
jgi:cytochrome b subunit of formate dehydrogenase